MKTRLFTTKREVIIGDDQPTVLIGERINPTGKKKMSEALKSGDLEIVQQEALAQVQAGADMLDVNAAIFGVDERELLPQIIQSVLEIVDVPLCIDSANIEAVEASLKVYKGKALINSVTGEEHSLGSVLPLAKEYGAAVIGLVQDEEGIPDHSERRVAIARKILERAEALGIPREDVIIDCIVLAVGADTRSGLITIETVRRIKSELGVNVIMAVSNASFGLPGRTVLNNAFVSIAIAVGVNCLIVDVEKVRSIVLATDLILNQDRLARRYIEAWRKKVP
jgi:5-methyltetrahydrofolate--homocysteine methyltransferase